MCPEYTPNPTYCRTDMIFFQIAIIFFYLSELFLTKYFRIMLLNSSDIFRLEAAISPPKMKLLPPEKSDTVPPAFSTSSTPAATSHGCRPYS